MALRKIAPSLSVVFAALGAVATALLLAPPALAVDYSNDPLKPSVVPMNGVGEYFFSGRVDGTSAANCPTTGNCFDYITITVPQNRFITDINLDFYNSTDDRAFIALQAGNQFTATVSGTGLPGSLAFNHFGWRGQCATSYGDLRPPAPYAPNNNCILADNSTPNPARLTDLFDTVLPTSPILSAPLPAGDYTFWIQQVSGDSEYVFRVSTPGPLPVLGAAAGFGFSRRLRRRVKQGQGA
jgi:hypothetical protein